LCKEETNWACNRVILLTQRITSLCFILWWECFAKKNHTWEPAAWIYCVDTFFDLYCILCLFVLQEFL